MLPTVHDGAKLPAPMDLLVIVGLLLLFGFLFFGRPKPDIDGEGARALVKNDDATLLDVRSPAEFGGDHLPDAINIPIGELSGRLAELKSDKKNGRPIVVYCQSGMRSAQAKKELERNGFERVHDLGSRHRW